MKRFWKEVVVEHGGDGWSVRLDGRPVRTPARASLSVPTEQLARGIADEWAGVEEKMEPGAMPLTGLANAAIDRVQPDRQAFASSLAGYGEADLTCYRAEAPRALAERQAEVWDPLLAWARRRYDVDFCTTAGIVHVPQPTATVNRLAHTVAALDPFQLAGLSPLVTIGGSLIAGLAVLEKAVSVAQAWEAVSVDERWQLDQWGADAEAEVALENRHRDFIAAAHFLELLDA
ncbi:chaperone required for assembly of F1-ATPase [Sphingomonas sp. F9_3S_D5_B_2]